MEEKLSTLIKDRFFIAGIPDEQLGQKVILVVEGEYRDFSKSTWDVLDKYEKPKAIFFVPKFLETETGKIKRKEIIKTLNQH